MFSEFTKEEIKLLKSLNTPVKIQDFLNGLKVNFEPDGDTCMSPKKVLQTGKAHCIEAAMLACVALRLNGYAPLVVDLESTKEDFDHVIAVFQKNGKWGAIGKSNHAVLRYREPIYRDVRELVMSFFHEYFLDSGKKTLRRFSEPINLKMFDDKRWMTSQEDVWFVAEYLANVEHTDLLNKKEIKNLRKADDIEIKAGKIVEQKS